MGHFLPFDSPNNHKNQNFEKIEKPLEILSFYTCQPQMTIWCMVPEISSVTDIIICHFGLFFALLSPPPRPPLPPINPENQRFEKIELLEILSFYTWVPKLMIIGYTVLEIWCVTNVIVVFHFGQFLALLPP